MGTRLTTKDLRGFLVLQEALRPAVYNAALTSITQATPRPGFAEGNDDSTIHPIIAGSQPRALTTKVLTPGVLPASAPRLGYRASTEAVASTRGWASQGMGPLNFTTPGGTAWGTTAWVGRDAVTLPDQRVLAVWSYASAMSVGVYNPATNAWVVTTSPLSTVYLQMPGLCVLADGTVLMAGYVVTAMGNQGRVYRSEDSGSTWTLVSGAGASSGTPFDATAVRVRLHEFSDGTLGMWLITATPTIAQYASVDGGVSWTSVATPALTAGSAAPDVASRPTVHGKGVMVAYADGTATRAKFLAGAFELLSQSTEMTATSNIYYELVAHAEASGRLVVAGKLAPSENVLAAASLNSGTSWSNVAGPLQTNAAAAGSAPLLDAARLGDSCGSLYLLHSFVAPVLTHDPSIALVFFGGWSSIIPVEAITYNPKHYLPYGTPDAGAIWATAGAGAIAISGGALVLSASTTTKQYSTSLGTNNQAMITATAQVSCTNLGDIMRVDVSDGATMRSVIIRASSTSIQVYNNGTVPGILTTLAVSNLNTPTNFLVAVDWTNALIVAYRAVGATAWTVVYEGTGLTAAVGVVGQYVWGRISAPATNSTLTWFATGVVNQYLAATAVGMGYRYLGSALAGYSSMTEGAYLLGGPVPLGPDQQTSGSATPCAVLAVDGPGVYGEEHVIAPSYDYPVEVLDPIVSPTSRVAWRSTSTAEQILGWDLTNATTVGNSRSVGVYLGRCSFRLAYLEGANGAGWTTLGTYDAAISTGLSWARTGDTIRISGGSAASRYIQRGELVGATVVITTTGGLVQAPRRIVAHSEGHWSTTAGRHLELKIALEGGEDSSGSVMQLIAHSGVLVVHNVNSTLYSQYRIRIPAHGVGSQLVRGSYMEAGLMLPGGVVVVGQQWSWGSNSTLDPRLETAETASGVLRTRKVGEPIESWTMSWSDGVDALMMRQDPTGASWLGDGSSATEGLATYGDVAWLLRGMSQEIGGGAVPLVALAAIPASSSTVTDPTLFLAGTLASPVSWELANGDESEDEVYRVGTVTIRGMP